jgi:DNA primase
MGKKGIRMMIKPEVVEDILNAARIEEVVGDFVRLTKRGVNYVGLCPFHNEKTASFTVNPAKGICKCFGCGEGGDAVGFMMKHEHYTYVEALRYLAQKYAIELKEEEQTPNQIKELNERETLFAVCAFAKTYFVQTLSQTEEGKSLGMPYFKERGFSLATIEKFQLGYAPQEKDGFTQHAIKNGYQSENLEKAGLSFRKDNQECIDRFRGRVMFPIHNFAGKVIGFGGRILSASKMGMTAKYINSPETSIYHKSDVLYGLYFAKTAIKKADKCLLVEGYTDVVSLYQAGIENVVASSGTSLTVGQIRLIGKLTDNITIVYDGDKAGIKAALRGISLVLQEGMNIRVVLLPEGEDPDSFARNHTKADSLAYITEHEESFIQFKTHLLLQEVGNDPIKKAGLINDIASDIALINDLIMRSVFCKQCSELLDVQEETMVQAVNKLRLKLYFDKQAKEKEQAVNSDEKEAFVQSQSDPPTMAQTMPLQEMSVDNLERSILQLLINRGEDMVYLRCEDEDESKKMEEMRLDQFIFNDLCNDDIIFQNSDYRKLFILYADVAEREPLHHILPVLSRHENETMRNLCLDLIDISVRESPLWESERIKSPIRCVHNDESKLLEDAIRKLQTLKLVKIRKLKTKKMEELQAASPDDEMIVLYELQQLSAKIKEIENVLGTTYRWN